MALSHPFFVFIAFLFLTPSVFCQFTWTEEVQKVYQLILSGEDTPIVLSKKSEGYSHYLKGIQIASNHFLRSQNMNSLFEINRELEALQKYGLQTDEFMFCLGELKFYSALLYLSEDSKWKALLNFRHSYQIHNEIISHNPGFIPSYKTRGFLKVIFGEAQYYTSFSKLFTGVKTTPESGMIDMQKVIDYGEFYNVEAQIFKVLALQFVCFEYEKATKALDPLLVRASPLDLTVAAIVLHKNNNSEKSSMCFQKSTIKNPYFDFLQGVNATYLLDFKKANQFFDRFLSQKWSAFKLSTYYYKAVIAKLEGKEQLFFLFSDLARKTEAIMPLDRSSSDKIMDLEHLKSSILKAHLLFDGGDWDAALLELNLLNQDLDSFLEVNYLLAKIAWYKGEFDNSISFFRTVLDGENTKDYYKPYSAYYLAKIYQERREPTTALIWLGVGESFDGYPHQRMIEVQLKKLKNEITK